MKFFTIIMLSIIALSFFLPSTIVLFSQNQPEIEEENITFTQVDQEDTEDADMVSVIRQDDQIKELPLEEYVAHVVASEMPVDFEMEALKAQAVAARTYVIQHQLNNQDEPISDTVNHQVYQSHEQLKEVWGVDYQSHLNKMLEATVQTSGEIIVHNDEPITPLYFSTSNGQTENPEDYWEQSLPYMKSVESPWDSDSPKYSDQLILTPKEIENKLSITPDDRSTEPIYTYTDSGRVKTLEWGNQSFTGREVRERLNLQSTDFTIDYQDEHYILTTKGYGHGVGMSQYGANGMAKEGYNYRDILTHYYQDVIIEGTETLE